MRDQAWGFCHEVAVLGLQRPYWTEFSIERGQKVLPSLQCIWRRFQLHFLWEHQQDEKQSAMMHRSASLSGKGLSCCLLAWLGLSWALCPIILCLGLLRGPLIIFLESLFLLQK